MARRSPQLVAILQLVLLSSLLLRTAANVEGDALYALRRSLVDPANVMQSWDPTLVNPCTWFHVTCNEHNHVTRIDLGNAKLSGSLSSELGNLEYLEYLELYKNHLSGEIPKELGKLKSLRSLDLYSNNLTGEIPRALGDLKSLRFLDLSNNDLCGTIPSTGSFAKFAAKSFERNPRLKGPELMGSVPYDVECE